MVQYRTNYCSTIMVTKTIKLKYSFSLQSVGTRDCYFILKIRDILTNK